MTERIKQNISIVQIFFYLGPHFFFVSDKYFQLMISPILNPKIQYKMQNQ